MASRTIKSELYATPCALGGFFAGKEDHHLRVSTIFCSDKMRLPKARAPRGRKPAGAL
jgi:hypothetical protein